MKSDLNKFVQYLTWSDTTLRYPLGWKNDYVRILKDIAAPFVQEKKELADAVHRATDDELIGTLFCPRVLWALTQARDRGNAIQEMLSELANRCAKTGTQNPANNGSPDSSNPTVNLTVAGIVIDFESSFELPGAFPSLAAAPTRRQNTEYQRIDSALRELEQTFPAVFLFVKDLTTRIAVRFRPDDPRFMLFGSFTEYPGVMLIVNPWQTTIDSARMIEAIVHENIHHAIAMFETVSHDLTAGITASSVHQSPWTGNFLTSHQFVEACFVWWGLYQMWLNWPLGSCVPETRSRELCDRAFKGFLSWPASALVEALGTTALPNDTTEALFAIEEAAVKPHNEYTAFTTKRVQ